MVGGVRTSRHRTTTSEQNGLMITKNKNLSQEREKEQNRYRPINLFDISTRTRFASCRQNQNRKISVETNRPVQYSTYGRRTKQTVVSYLRRVTSLEKMYLYRLCASVCVCLCLLCKGWHSVSGWSAFLKLDLAPSSLLPCYPTLFFSLDILTVGKMAALSSFSKRNRWRQRPCHFDKVSGTTANMLGPLTSPSPDRDGPDGNRLFFRNSTFRFVCWLFHFDFFL